MIMKKKTETRQPHPISISEFNNVWNQLAIELAKPHLNPLLKSDEEKVNRLRERLQTLKP